MGPFFVKRRKIYFEENRFNERFSECLVFYINRHINIESHMYKVTNFGGFREDLATFVDPSRGVSSNSVTAGSTHVVKPVVTQPSVVAESRRVPGKFPNIFA